MARILVIDDDRLMRSIILRILARAGHETFEAADGREGAIKFREERPGVVISDIFMPDQEGIATILDIRRAPFPTKILAISGTDPALLEAARRFGADAVLPKPFRGEELLRTVERLLTS